jgi:hypothetical protein
VSSPQVIEDACASAWARFLERQPDRDRNWKGWLFLVAQRESWRLDREASQEMPTRTGAFEAGAWLAADPRDQYAIRDDVEDAFSILERLSPRLRRIAMLRALGLMHREISEITGDSQVRVAQLIARANFEIYEVLAERAHETEHVSPRAARLWELERDQPTWLTDRIGRAPRSSRRSVGQTEQRRPASDGSARSQAIASSGGTDLARSLLDVHRDSEASVASEPAAPSEPREGEAR